ncbi:MAG: hypothetical protein HN855_13325 [Anaerolineae bacterium]|nr:hypothetical protein [Anaerolineae bacterium]
MQNPEDLTIGMAGEVQQLDPALGPWQRKGLAVFLDTDSAFILIHCNPQPVCGLHFYSIGIGDDGFLATVHPA